ncbi:hypothetical protein H8356DRAFT_1361131 [Neocallimastix lanati (nom. inval.)]|nr:hypothetical protein H8356DRAFT_1361131 [Neocallimastix sp. JGI-2020a]
MEEKKYYKTEYGDNFMIFKKSQFNNFSIHIPSKTIHTYNEDIFTNGTFYIALCSNEIDNNNNNDLYLLTDEIKVLIECNKNKEEKLIHIKCNDDDIVELWKLLEFDNNGYHRRIYDKDFEPGWNWNLLGNEYNGVTDKTADDVVKFIKELSECDNYHFFCHNYHEFVKFCSYVVVTLFTSIAESIIKGWADTLAVNNKTFNKMIERTADLIVETYECSIRNLENSIYEVTCFGKPVIYAILDNVFESNNLQIIDNIDSDEITKPLHVPLLKIFIINLHDKTNISQDT